MKADVIVAIIARAGITIEDAGKAFEVLGRGSMRPLPSLAEIAKNIRVAMKGSTEK